jgi:hypothetical protein
MCGSGEKEVGGYVNGASKDWNSSIYLRMAV